MLVSVIVEQPIVSAAVSISLGFSSIYLSFLFFQSKKLIRFERNLQSNQCRADNLKIFFGPVIVLNYVLCL